MIQACNTIFDGDLWKGIVTCLNSVSFTALVTWAVLSNLELEWSSEHKISILSFLATLQKIYMSFLTM